MTFWTRWLRQPQSVWLRKALFQIHLWSGIGAGLYILIIGLTGSVLVYRVEIMRYVTPKPIIAVASGERLTDDQLKEAAARAYPDFSVVNLFRARNKDQAVDIWMKRGTELKQRLFDPYTARDLGDTVPASIKSVSWILNLHDNLLAGPTGRLVNGIGAIVTIVLAVTGLVIWWPGIRKWRRSLFIHRKVGWKRFNWDLHSALGIWSVLFVLLFGITGAYLCFPGPFGNAADAIQPMTEANAGRRTVDTVTYWLARSHFGRFGGWSTKIIWATFGLAPVFLFLTAAVMWWNRVLGPGLQAVQHGRRVRPRAKRREAI
jgi:uncharacterized iron-regulated membrane protein